MTLFEYVLRKSAMLSFSVHKLRSYTYCGFTKEPVVYPLAIGSVSVRAA